VSLRALGMLQKRRLALKARENDGRTEDRASPNRLAPRSDDDHSNAPSVLVAFLNRIPRARGLSPAAAGL
jgi:hypothetical protein